MAQSLNARMGLNTWAGFTGTQEDAVIAGDVAMLDNEVTSVLKVLRKNPGRRNDFTRIDFELRDDSTNSLKVLSFQGCANFQFVMDFDVLAENWPVNTESSVAKTDVARMRKFVKVQMAHWRTTYMPPMTKDKPVRKKLASLRSYILFQVAFFGGTAEILAKHYSLKR